MGGISSDLGIKHNSSFVNLFIKASDYVKMLANLKMYLEEELYSVSEEDSIYGKVAYPTAYLGDVKIYFMHYSSEQEAREAWECRKKELIGIIYTYFLQTGQDAQNKICEILISYHIKIKLCLRINHIRTSKVLIILKDMKVKVRWEFYQNGKIIRRLRGCWINLTL